MSTIRIFPEYRKMIALTGSRFVISPDGWKREMDAFNVTSLSSTCRSAICVFYIGSVPYFKLQKRLKFGEEGKLLVNVSGTDYIVGTYRRE